MEIARRALPGFARAASANKTSYGFEKNDDTGQARLGPPFEVFALDSHKVKKASTPFAVTNLLAPAGEWIFPVHLQGSNRVVLIVRRLEQGWKAIYFGNGPLARELGRLHEVWPETGGTRVTLVSLTDIRSFWFTVHPRPTENLTPLNDLKLPTGQLVARPASRGATLPSAESIPKLAQALLKLESETNFPLLDGEK